MANSFFYNAYLLPLRDKSSYSFSHFMNHKGRTIYILGDYLASFLAWTCFYLYRKIYNEEVPINLASFESSKYLSGVFLISLAWIVFYALFDSYRNPYRMSRFEEAFRALWMGFVGSVILFFAILLDDIFKVRPTYIASFVVLLTLECCFPILSRFIILTYYKKQIKKGKIAFNTLIIGGNAKALNLYKEITAMQKSLGNRFVGYIETNGGHFSEEMNNLLPLLGNTTDIPDILRKYQVEEAIIAIDTVEHDKMRLILNQLFVRNVQVRIIPDIYDILLGSVRLTNVFGIPLIEIRRDVMPIWQRIIKRCMDLLLSSLVIIIGSPIFLFLALRVKLASPGPIFFRQPRLGLNGTTFHIIKFRTMRIDAEKDGPQLASKTDNRITSSGRWMRKFRLDELPQFWNVIRGDMSLVGPRPERQFYFDQIVARASHAQLLHKVKPGITSWGQVKYGYAENVDEMIQRLSFDILYIENMSLALDFKIMFYTVLVILQGRGK